MKFLVWIAPLMFVTIASAQTPEQKIDAVQQAQIQQLQKELDKTRKDLETLIGANSSTGIIRQNQAQATCTALRGTSPGWAFAVIREDPKKTCQTICSGIVDSQVPAPRCFNALHIYGSNNPATASHTAGLKTFVYNSCSNLEFGPNYCCCGGE